MLVIEGVFGFWLLLRQKVVYKLVELQLCFQAQRDELSRFKTFFKPFCVN